MGYNPDDMVSFTTRLFHYALFGTLMSGAIEVYLFTLDYRVRIVMNLIILAEIVKQEYFIWAEQPCEKIDDALRADDEAPRTNGASYYGNQRLPEPHLA